MRVAEEEREVTVRVVSDGGGKCLGEEEESDCKSLRPTFLHYNISISNSRC